MREIDFLSKRRLALICSCALLLLTLFSLLIGRVRWGIDFTGGQLLHIRFLHPVSVKMLASIRESLDEEGMICSIQRMGEQKKEVLIKAASRLSFENMKKRLKRFGDFLLLRSERVGPSLSKQLCIYAIIALTFAILCMMLYICIRFKAAFAIAAVVALLHDVFVTLGAVSLHGSFINIPIIAALLTIMGYSLNDTIVVFDRVRENMKMTKAFSFTDLINRSINQTLGRTLITSLTTLMVLLFLYFFGANVIKEFAFALIVGVVSGTYSTIFVACPILHKWGRGKRV